MRSRRPVARQNKSQRYGWYARARDNVFLRNRALSLFMTGHDAAPDQTVGYSTGPHSATTSLFAPPPLPVLCAVEKRLIRTFMAGINVAHCWRQNVLEPTMLYGIPHALFTSSTLLLAAFLRNLVCVV